MVFVGHGRAACCDVSELMAEAGGESGPGGCRQPTRELSVLVPSGAGLSRALNRSEVGKGRVTCGIRGGDVVFPRYPYPFPFLMSFCVLVFQVSE